MIIDNLADDYEVTFFLPTEPGMQELGGAQLLFLQVAEYVAKNYNFKVNFIDSDQGRIANKLKSVNLIYYNKNQEINLHGKHLLISSLVNLRKIAKFIKLEKSSKIFLWNLGTSDYNCNLGLMGLYSRVPLNLRKKAINFFEYRTKRKLEELMLLLVEKNAVAFMSGKNFIFLNKYITIKAKPLYLPVGINDTIDKNAIYQNRNASKDEKVLNLGWLGRFAKTNTLLLIMDSLEDLGNNNGVFHIIGWGTEKEKNILQNYASQKGIKVKIIEGLYDEELNDYLIQNIDLGVAMGLSLLNFASLKIPVIATEQFHKKKQIKGVLLYKWFYELKNFDLATTLSFSGNREDMHKLDFFINIINKNYKECAEKCFDFYYGNYRFSEVISGLLKKAGTSKLKGDDLENIKSLLYRNTYHKLFHN